MKLFSDITEMDKSLFRASLSFEYSADEDPTIDLIAIGTVVSRNTSGLLIVPRRRFSGRAYFSVDCREEREGIESVCQVLHNLGWSKIEHTAPGQNGRVPA